MAAAEQQLVRSQAFEGPLHLLLALAERHEIDLRQISLAEIAIDFASAHPDVRESIDSGAEFITQLASLLLLKATALLPGDPVDLESSAEAEGMQWELLSNVIDCCSLRRAATKLEALHLSARGRYPRPHRLPQSRTEHQPFELISLEELSGLFDEVLKRATKQRPLIQRERWKVSDALQALRALFSAQKQRPFAAIFKPSKCREELVVTFLALLELMKLGELAIRRGKGADSIVIIGTKAACAR